MQQEKGSKKKKCIELRMFLKILVFRSLTFKKCNFTMVKTRFLKMFGFGAKIVLAKTWGFKGAKMKKFWKFGVPPLTRKDTKWATRDPPHTTKSSSKGTLKHPRGHLYIRNGVLSKIYVLLS